MTSVETESLLRELIKYRTRWATGVVFGCVKQHHGTLEKPCPEGRGDCAEARAILSCSHAASEREAWLALAAIVANDQRSCGMCSHIRHLLCSGVITDAVCRRMMLRINRELSARGIGLAGHLYPVGAKGIKKRAAFCRKQARELERKMKGIGK